MSSVLKVDQIQSDTGTVNVASKLEFPAGTVSAPSIFPTGDTNTGIFFPAAETIAFAGGGAEAMRIDSSANLQFNSGYGSVATAYGCRAWVNFNGTGTVAIRASGNVSSITDNGTGDYTVNFTTAMPDANYSTVLTGGNSGGLVAFMADGNTPPTSSAVRIRTANSSFALTDQAITNVAIFR